MTDMEEVMEEDTEVVMEVVMEVAMELVMEVVMGELDQASGDSMAVTGGTGGVFLTRRRVRHLVMTVMMIRGRHYPQLPRRLLKPR